MMAGRWEIIVSVILLRSCNWQYQCWEASRVAKQKPGCGVWASASGGARNVEY